MKELYITLHAKERYCERVLDVSITSENLEVATTVLERLEPDFRATNELDGRYKIIEDVFAVIKNNTIITIYIRPQSSSNLFMTNKQKKQIKRNAKERELRLKKQKYSRSARSKKNK